MKLKVIHIIFPFLLVCLWELLVQLQVIPEQSFAPPTKAASSFLKLFTSINYWGHILISLRRLLLGFFLGGVLGVLLGYVVSTSNFFSKIIEPTILSLIPVPPMAWIPVLIALLGIGEFTKISLVSIGSFSVLFVATAAGVRAVDKKLLELAKVYNKSTFDIAKYIIFPHSLNYILSNLRIAMALSWTLLLASEIINSSSGIGWFIWDSRRFYRSDEMVVGIVTIGLLGKTCDLVIVKLQLFFNKWNSSLYYD